MPRSIGGTEYAADDTRPEVQARLRAARDAENLNARQQAAAQRQAEQEEADAARQADEDERAQVAIDAQATNEKKAKVRRLVAQRGGHKATITKTVKKLEEAQRNLTGETLAQRLNALKTSFEASVVQVTQKNKELEDCWPEAEIAAFIDETQDYVESLASIRERFNASMVQYHHSNPASMSRPKDIVIPTPAVDSRLVKLPNLELPIFKGDYKDYPMWHDQFQSCIGDQKVSDVNKLSFLKNALQGEPLKLIFRLGSNDTGSYQRGMEILEERYRNPRLICRAHLNQIMTFPHVKENDSHALRRLVVNFGDAIAGLRHQGINVADWDVILVFHVLQKLDTETQRDFNMKHPGRNIPKIQPLMDYLRDRANAYEDASSGTSKAEKKKEKSAKKADDPTAFASMSNNQKREHLKKQKETDKKAPKSSDSTPADAPTKKCVECSEEHWLYECPEYTKLDIKGKKAVIKKHRHCFNCCRPGHAVGDCKSHFRCRVCKGKHHTSLHDPDAVPLGHAVILPGPIPASVDCNVPDVTPTPPLLPEGNTSTSTPTAVAVTPSTSNTTVSTLPPSSRSNVAERSPDTHRSPDTSGTTNQTELRSNDTMLRNNGAVRSPVSDRSNEATSVDPIAAVAVGLGSVSDSRVVILGTCIVPITDSEGGTQYGRAMLDNCAQVNFVSEKFLKKLGFPKVKTKRSVSTVGCAPPQATNGVVTIKLPLPTGEPLKVVVHVLTAVTSFLPTAPLSPSYVDSIKSMDVNLADPDFDVQAEIDLLLGVETYEQLLLNDRLRSGSVALTSTHFGWVVTGAIPSVATKHSNFTRKFVDPFTALVTVDDDIRKFWEVNDVRDYSVLAKDPATYTEEERFTIDHFERTTIIDNEGYYVVEFPFLPPPPTGPPLQLGTSLGAAVRMLTAVYKKFPKSPPEFEKLYREFVADLIELGHVERITWAELVAMDCKTSYCMPHHAVEKESTTTKLRIVTNASAPTSTKVSFNQLLAVGPKLQDDLVCHLVRFLFFRVAVTGDISKMYRMLKLTPAHKNYCCFLWKDSPDGEIQAYRFTRVTYGIVSSSFHAIYAMVKTACTNAKSQSVINVVRDNFYVDDLITGTDTIASANQMIDDLNATLGVNHFCVRKYASNEPSVITRLDPKLKENSEAFDFKDHSHMVKMLGVAWLPLDDSFYFRVNHLDDETRPVENLTKRQLLGDILKLFDPMGWLSPVTLKLKYFMQTTWAQGLTWDEPLPDDIREPFLKWTRNLTCLRNIKKPRCVLATGKTEVVQLHVFCDASETGYAACVYARVVDDTGEVNVSLVFAKAKVTPVKSVSIPRLELLAAVLGAKCLTIVMQSLSKTNVVVHDVFAYSDSTTVLAWLSKPSKNWTTFVSNRVSEIQNQFRRPSWFHVKSEDNPADVASRGLNPDALPGHDLWWHGPKWLDADFTTPDQSHLLNHTLEEQRPHDQMSLFCGSVIFDTTLEKEQPPESPSPEVSPINEKFMDLSKTSNFERTVRVTAHVFRFLSSFRCRRERRPETTVVAKFQKAFHPQLSETKLPREDLFVAPTKRRRDAMSARLKFPPDRPDSKHVRHDVDHIASKFPRLRNEAIVYPSPGETTYVRRLFILREQKEHLGTEYALLKSGRELTKGSKLLQFYPFIDDDEILKVGGRLAHAEHLSDAQRYQVIIPKASPLARLLAHQVHIALIHGTVQGCLAALREKYWITGAKTLIKNVIRECTTCFRFMGRPSHPLMGDLPKERVTPSPPFEHTGVDFGGPFQVRASGTTGNDKAYLALFVCFATKAVHLELVGSLSTPCCLAAFRRFTARCGTPKQVYSDNGTNFVGSRHEIERLQELLEKKGKDTMPALAASTGTSWVHIPPRAPHMGGLWESSIKSAKGHLKRILGNNVVTYEELNTVFVCIEAVLNSRPLVELSSDDHDYTALTPSMLITGRHLTHLPLETTTTLPDCPPQDYAHPKRRWDHLNKLVSHFWSRWIREYLPTLQQRKKWQKETPNLQVGELILVAEDNLAPLHWPLARIVQVHPGNDDFTRVATIRTPKGVYQRPVHKLRRLPCANNAASLMK